MKRLSALLAAIALLGATPSLAQISTAGPAQYGAPPGGGGGGGSGTVTSVAITVPSILAVSGSPITTAGTFGITLNTQSANGVFAGPTTGAAAAPTFRALVGADLPAPGASSAGGVYSKAAASHNFLTQIGTDGSVSAAQPACADLSNAGVFCPASAGTGVITALGVNVGSAGAPVVNGGALGTPSSGTGTNITGIPNAAVIGLGSAALVNTGTSGATIPLLNAANTFSGNTTVSSASFGLSGNISAPAWTTAGIRYANAAATLTDTTSSGTVASATSDLWSGSTIAASSATTFTNYDTATFKVPTAGTNVTMTNKAAIAADSIRIGGATIGSNALAVTGTALFNNNVTLASSIQIFGSTGTTNPTISLSGSTDRGFGFSQSRPCMIYGGACQAASGAASGASLSLLATLSWGAGDPTTSAQDLFIGRAAAAAAQLGAAASASPVAQILQSQGSRGGTDTNTAGGSLTITSGNGTGNATPSDLILKSPVATTSGTSAQTQTTGLTIDQGTAVLSGYTVATLPVAPKTGAMAYVTDADACVNGATPTHTSGTAFCSVIWNGAAWHGITG